MFLRDRIIIYKIHYSIRFYILLNDIQDDIPVI